MTFDPPGYATLSHHMHCISVQCAYDASNTFAITCKLLSTYTQNTPIITSRPSRHMTLTCFCCASAHHIPLHQRVAIRRDDAPMHSQQHANISSRHTSPKSTPLISLIHHPRRAFTIPLHVHTIMHQRVAMRYIDASNTFAITCKHLIMTYHPKAQNHHTSPPLQTYDFRPCIPLRTSHTIDHVLQCAIMTPKCIRINMPTAHHEIHHSQHTHHITLHRPSRRMTLTPPDSVIRQHTTPSACCNALY